MQQAGIAAADIKKLTDNGLFTIETLAHSTRKELEAIKGLSAAKVDKLLKEGACSLVSSPCSGEQALLHRQPGPSPA